MTFKGVIKQICEGIAYHPIDFVHRVKENRHFYNIFCHADDTGLLCGKGACNIKALQQIFGEIGRRENLVIGITIGDKPGTARTGQNPIFKVTDTWTRSGEVAAILQTLLHPFGGADIGEPEEMYDSTNITVAPRKDLPPGIFSAIDTVIRAWGRSQGRHIFLFLPEHEKK